MNTELRKKLREDRKDIEKKQYERLHIEKCVRCKTKLSSDYSELGGLPFCSKKCFDEWKDETGIVFALLRFHAETNKQIGLDIIRGREWRGEMDFFVDEEEDDQGLTDSIRRRIYNSMGGPGHN